MTRQPRRIGVVVLALLAASLAAFVLMRAFNGGSTQVTAPVEKTTEPRTEYEITLPAGATPSAAPGQYEIYATTDLPDLTRAYIEFEGSQAGGASCCISVQGGLLIVPVANNDCSSEAGQVTSLPFTLTVIVAPDYSIYQEGPPEQSPRTDWQPASVVAILREGFSALTGDEVRKIGNMNELVVSAKYQLPSDTCTSQ